MDVKILVDGAFHDGRYYLITSGPQPAQSAQPAQPASPQPAQSAGPIGDSREERILKIDNPLIGNAKITMMRREVRWLRRYSLLKTFIKDHGRPPYRRELNTISRWCSTQRRKYRDGTMCEKRAKLLDKLLF